MAKTTTLEINEVGILNEPSLIEVKSAQIKDLMCNYSYELIAGTGEGDLINRKGSAIVHDDLQYAFNKLIVHLALICEEINIEDIGDRIEDFESMDFKEEWTEWNTEYKVSMFWVSGFRIEKQSVILEGSKKLSTMDSVKLTTPKIKFEETSYKFIGELVAALEDCKMEVEAYMNGKAAPKYEQSEMQFGEEGDDDLE